MKRDAKTPFEMIATASSDFSDFKVNKVLKRVWRGTSPLVLQRQSSSDLSSLEETTMKEKLD